MVAELYSDSPLSKTICCFDSATGLAPIARQPNAMIRGVNEFIVPLMNPEIGLVKIHEDYQTVQSAIAKQ